MDLFYGRANYIDEHGDTIGEYDTREFQLEEFKGRCTICQPAAFWCRRIMDRIGLLTRISRLRWIMNTGNASLLTKGLSLASINCWRVRAEYSATKTKSQRGKVCMDVFKSQWRHWGERSSRVVDGDSSITLKRAPRPVECLRSGFQVRGLILFPLPFPSQAVFQV